MLGATIYTLIVVALFYILYLVFKQFYFLRDPVRAIPHGDNLVSPADGKVIQILDTGDKELKIKKGLLGKIEAMCSDIAKECYVISIFMSPLNVHINRTPMTGKIISVKHTKGKFFNAGNLEKSLMNEKNEIIIENKKIKIKIIQIAGFLARRIECFVKKDQKILKGQRIGLINLGSQVTVIMPKKVKPAIKIGQKIKAGSSIIGYLK